MEKQHIKAEDILQKINQKESETNKGKIVAIETESEDYFVGSSEIDAYHKAVKKYPKKQFVFKRIGFPATHFVGALE
ncbi:MAG: hypothetical protein Q7R76_01020 [Candidatus Woesearchaeota archaeon]|nr:hypothetical protein [Candidatus Woesearchaeota archaeon]